MYRFYSRIANSARDNFTIMRNVRNVVPLEIIGLEKGRRSQFLNLLHCRRGDNRGYQPRAKNSPL